MTEIQVARKADGSIQAIHVSGHAGYADLGEDIVCAGISALVATALIGLKQVADHPHDGKVTAGRMFCRLKPGGTPESAARAQAILETIVLGLKDLANDYHQFVRVTEGG